MHQEASLGFINSRAYKAQVCPRGNVEERSTLLATFISSSTILIEGSGVWDKHHLLHVLARNGSNGVFSIV